MVAKGPVYRCEWQTAETGQGHSCKWYTSANGQGHSCEWYTLANGQGHSCEWYTSAKGQGHSCEWYTAATGQGHTCVMTEARVNGLQVGFFIYTKCLLVPFFLKYYMTGALEAFRYWGREC